MKTKDCQCISFLCYLYLQITSELLEHCYPFNWLNMYLSRIDLCFTAVQLGETRKLTVLTHLTDRPSAPCSVVSQSPKGEMLEMPVEMIPQGYEVLFTPTEKGDHKLKVNFANQELPDSPFTAKVDAVDVSSVVVKGLEKRKYRLD